MIYAILSTKGIDMDTKKLVGLAREAATRAYAPYSHFRVGSALLLSDGTVVTGSNVENRSYGLTNCAERSAIFAAISQGRTDFTALAVYSPESEVPLPPCGACRQVISEFVSADFPVYCASASGEVEEVSMQDLLPKDSLKNFKDTGKNG
jgi:cytidine deaminase